MKIRDAQNYQYQSNSSPESRSPPNSIASDETDIHSELEHESVNNFEDLLKICGEAGWWQLKVFLLASYCGFLTSLQNLIYAFIGAVPDHWCELPNVTGYTVDELKELTIPLDKNGEYEKCIQFERQNTAEVWTKDSLIVNRNRTESCQNMDFDSSIFTSTIVTNFDLVCGSQVWASVIQAIFMIGILIGSPIFGSISDKIGRKKTTLIGSIIFIIAGPLVALAPNFETLMFARFILGASSPGIYATSFVLAVETVGPGWRGMVGNLFCLPFALGYMTLPGVAYFFRDWRNLQLVLSAPSLLQILVCWLSPESPRWLLRKGRVAEAELILRNAAKTNGRSKRIPSNFHELVQKVASVEKEVLVTETGWRRQVWTTLSKHALLFKTPQLRKRTLVLYVCWLCISMVYYGVALNSPNLSADRYLYTFLSGVLEIPSYAMVPPLIKYLGRRPVFSGFLLLCGTSLLSSLLFSEGSVLIVVLALVGKLLIGAAYALIYLYATEVMPTLLRTFGVGSASMVGRIGSASAPFIVDLVGRENKTTPTLIFGVISVASGVLSLILPETRNKRLPETVSDVENDVT